MRNVQPDVLAPKSPEGATRSTFGERPDIAVLLPDLRGGGAERVGLDLAQGFAARGRLVEMVLMRAEGDWIGAIPAGVGLSALGSVRLRSTLRPLAAYLSSRRPRSLLASMWPLTSVAVWANLLVGGRTRVVVVDHNDFTAAPQGATASKRAIMRLTMGASYPLAVKAVGVSQGVAQAVRRFSSLRGPRVQVIYNPIASRSPKPIEDVGQAEAWLHHRGPRLIAVGSLKRQKGFPVLLQAFARLRREVDARLLILGDGPERAELHSLRDQLGLQTDVFLPGFKQRPEDWLARSDLFVLSSLWEGFGNVLVESLGQGVPVVSTDCRSGPSEILEGGRHGVLVPPGDPDGLAEGIAAALRRPWDRQALRERAAFFSAERAVDAYLELLLPPEVRR